MYDSPLEDVYTVDDWYDGPRSGFAQYNGVPHHYRSVYLDHDEWKPDEDRFELGAVSPTLLAAAIEAEAIFRRWDAERQSGNVAWKSSDPESEFGALPDERERYAALRALILPYEASGLSEAFVARGQFELGCKRVQWRVEESPPELTS